MKLFPPKRITLLLIFIATALGGFVVLNWSGFRLVAAIILSEHRPGLLDDAQWNEPASARKFQRRFQRGVAEHDLITWLERNRFSIDRSKSQASRAITSLPCNERVQVTWSADAVGNLSTASAQVSEAGCL